MSGRARERVSERFAVGAGQVTAVLRLPLVGLMTFIGTVVDEPHLNAAAYRGVLAVFAVWSLGVAWWMFTARFLGGRAG